jgi:hypothetical protein
VSAESKTWNRYALHSAELFKPVPEYQRTPKLRFELTADPSRPVKCVDGRERPQSLCVNTHRGWIYRGAV